jgi:uncharacterized protein YdhG (YjbR/CyaY superfamily)
MSAAEIDRYLQELDEPSRRTLEPADLAGLTASKGALKFAIDAPLPDDLVAKLVSARLTEVAG